MTYSHVGYKSAEGFFKKFGFRILSLVPVRVVHNFSKIIQHKHNNKTGSRAHMIYFQPDGLRIAQNKPTERYGWDKRWLTEIEEYKFEDHMFYGPQNYDACLRWSYGPNYMEYPPESERVSSAPCSDYSF